jgi:hypothetical protein
MVEKHWCKGTQSSLDIMVIKENMTSLGQAILNEVVRITDTILIRKQESAGGPRHIF